MKFISTRRVPTAFAVIFLIAGFAATAQNQGASAAAGAAVPGAIDPATGLPSPQGAEQWIGSDWRERASGQRLPDIAFQDLPVSQVATVLREKFKEAFDVIIPNMSQNPYIQANTFSLDSVSVRLQLKDVCATEVFNAMNLTFESENAPVRWQLKMNGDRPVAVLRVVLALLPQGIDPTAPEKKRMVYFVGDLIGDGPPGGMTMDQLFETVSSVYDMAYNSGPTAASRIDLKFHEEAQLLVVTGTADRIDFVQSTLAALRQKELSARARPTFGGGGSSGGVPTKPEPPVKPEPPPAPNK